MKTSASFNLKTGLLLLGLCALPFAGCEKDNTEPNRGNNNQPQKHNVELKYGDNPYTNWQHIEIDTISKYNADPTVDSIFMIPEISSQFDAISTQGLQIRVTKLRERHNVNPNKVFGKGNLILNAESVQDNPEIVRFFADTLRYNVTTR